MSSEDFVAAPMTRFVAASTGILFLAALYMQTSVWEVPPAGIVWITIAVGLAAFISLVHTHRVIYSKWMNFAEKLQLVVVTILFSVCYCLVVPFFALLAVVAAMAQSRTRTKNSFWKERPIPPHTIESMRRMG